VGGVGGWCRWGASRSGAGWLWQHVQWVGGDQVCAVRRPRQLWRHRMWLAAGGRHGVLVVHGHHLLARWDTAVCRTVQWLHTVGLGTASSCKHHSFHKLPSYCFFSAKHCGLTSCLTGFLLPTQLFTVKTCSCKRHQANSTEGMRMTCQAHCQRTCRAPEPPAAGSARSQ
jgi:hypothetical protein